MIRRWSGFASSLVANLAVSLVTLPILIHAVGASDWAALAVGQATGGLVASVGGWGWTFVGASRVAALEDRDQGAEYFVTSVLVRLALCASLVLPTLAIVDLIGTADDTAASLSACTALCAGGLVPGWYYAGIRSPGRLFALITLPVILGAIIGTVLAAYTHQASAYAGALLAGNLVVVLLTWFNITHGLAGARMRKAVSAKAALAALKQQSDGVVVTVVANVYITVPMTVVAWAFPHQINAFAMADRLYRLAAAGASTLTQVLQGTIPGRRADETLGRMLAVLPKLSVLAVLGALGYAIAGPVAGRYLSHGQISIPWSIAVGYAIALAAVAITSPVGSACLAIIGESRVVVVSVVGASAVGALAMALTISRSWGAPGVAASIAVAEVTVLYIQLQRLYRRARDARSVPV